MTKFFTLIPRRSDLTVDEFHRHWQSVHGPLALQIAALTGYVQNQVVRRALAGSATTIFDGVSEAWFSGRHAGASPPHHSDEQYRDGARRDEDNFMDRPRRSYINTSEHIFIDAAVPAEAVKALVLVRRAPQLPAEEFAETWLAHSPAPSESPPPIRLIKNPALPQMYELSTQPVFDGITELWWSDQQSADAAFADDAIRRLLELDSPYISGESAVVQVVATRFR